MRSSPLIDIQMEVFVRNQARKMIVFATKPGDYWTSFRLINEIVSWQPFGRDFESTDVLITYFSGYAFLIFCINAYQFQSFSEAPHIVIERKLKKYLNSLTFVQVISESMNLDNTCKKTSKTILQSLVF